MKISHYNTDNQAFKNALNLLGTSQEINYSSKLLSDFDVKIRLFISYSAFENPSGFE